MRATNYTQEKSAKVIHSYYEIWRWARKYSHSLIPMQLIHGQGNKTRPLDRLRECFYDYYFFSSSLPSSFLFQYARMIACLGLNSDKYVQNYVQSWLWFFQRQKVLNMEICPFNEFNFTLGPLSLSKKSSSLSSSCLCHKLPAWWILKCSLECKILLFFIFVRIKGS